MTTTSMQQFVEGWLFDPTIGKLVSATVAILIVMALVRVGKGGVTRYIKEPGNLYRANKMVTFLGYFTGIIVLSMIFSANLGKMAVAFGVAGAGIAFALQEVIASLAGWVAISFGNFYNTGDRVQLGGIKGDVIDIGMLRTTMMEIGQWVNADLYNGRIVKIANSFVFKEPVFNYSGDFPFLWDEVTVPVKYGCDYRLSRDIFQRVLVEVTGEYSTQAKASWTELIHQYRVDPTEIDPRVFLVANDNWMEFTLRYIVDYKKRRITKDQLFTRILEEVDQTNGRVALASATFHLVETPEIKVQLVGPSEGRQA
ncbi:MAG: mechanosensitive ion channel [Nitrospirota bacterium]|nr:mechanosensitive ion channel [Nitrospirota bacterium]MDP3598483.1 mechanosensitive ion channel [Nitrospirota bacterium]